MLLVDVSSPEFCCDAVSQAALLTLAVIYQCSVCVCRCQVHGYSQGDLLWLAVLVIRPVHSALDFIMRSPCGRQPPHFLVVVSHDSSRSLTSACAGRRAVSRMCVLVGRAPVGIDLPASGPRHADRVCTGQQHGAGGQLADAIRVPMSDHTPGIESAARRAGSDGRGLRDLGSGVGVAKGSRRMHIRGSRVPLLTPLH